VGGTSVGVAVGARANMFSGVEVAVGDGSPVTHAAIRNKTVRDNAPVLTSANRQCLDDLL